MAKEPRRTHRYLPPPWWGVLTLPFGLTVGFATLAVPYALRGRGVAMTLIASVTQIAQLPHVIKLLWAPALDAGPKRRTWYLGSIAVTALCLAALSFITPSTTETVGPVSLLWVYTAVLFAAQAAVATSSSAVLALMAVTVPEARRGAAAGWQSAGNLVGTAVGGALVAWMLGHLSARATAITLAVICGAGALPAAFIDETAPPRRDAWQLVVALLRDVVRTLRSREGWTGMLICLSPVGTGALTNLFSALADDYARDPATAEHLVIVVTGILGGIANAIGALAGGYLADRMNRRLAYVAFGGLTALCALGMMLAPPTPLAFTVGCLGYQLANGLCFAAFYAFVLDLLGESHAVTTKLALYIGASNLAISYVTWLDGYSYDRAKAIWPTQARAAARLGMLGMDALSTFAGIAALALMAAYLRPARKTQRASTLEK